MRSLVVQYRTVLAGFGGLQPKRYDGGKRVRQGCCEDHRDRQMAAHALHMLHMLHGALDGYLEGEGLVSPQLPITRGGVLAPLALSDKGQRWLGFVQGVMWSLSLYTIDDLREHMRRAQA